MNATPRTIRAALAATLALLILPAPAFAEYLVPSGNSAVTQYTEGFPTARGEKGSEGAHQKKPVTPSKAIGAENAKRLDEQGAEGQAAAEVAAETAPPRVTPNGGTVQPRHHKGSQGQQGKDNPNGEENSSGAAAAPSDNGPGGSSGIGEVLAAATGSSDDGSLGLLLPLVILAAIAWSLTYFWRQRKQAAAQ